MSSEREAGAALLGILPNGWEALTLSELVDPLRGISYGIVQPGNHTPSGIPIVRVTDVRDGRIRTTEPLRVDATIESKYRRTRLRGGELVLSLVGTVGECAVVPTELAGWNTARAIAVVPPRDGIEVRWVYFCLRSPSLQHLMKTLCTTTVQATLNLGEVNRIPIPMPPARDRHAILELLGTLDDKIDANLRMNETLEATAAALFKAWFLDFDPVRAKMAGRAPAGVDAETAALFPSELTTSALGLIPAGWEVEPLDAVAAFLNGLALQKFPPDGPQSLPVIKIAEMRRGDTVGSDRASLRVPPSYIIADGDILFSWSGSLTVVIWCGGIGALNQHLFKVTSDRFPRWLYHRWVLHHLPEFQAIAADKATTMGHIQRGHLSKALVPVPPQALIDRVSPLFEQLESKWITNNLQNRTLRALRDELIPKLISGELRVAGTPEES